MLRLRQKFILWFAGILICLFALIFMFVRFAASFAFERPVIQNTFTAQSETDTLVAEIFYEVTYLYTAIISGGNADLINNMAQMGEDAARDVFDDILSALSYNKTLIKNVVLITGGKTLKLNSGFDLPVREYIDEVSDSPDSMPVGPNLNGCVLLGKAVRGGEFYDDGVLLFYVNEQVISESLKIMAETSKSYALLMTGDYYIFSSTDSSFAGTSVFEKSIFPLDRAPYYAFIDFNGRRCTVIISRAAAIQHRYNIVCYFVNILDYEQTFESFIALEYLLIGLSAATLITAVAFAFFRAKKLSQPLNSLNASIKRVVETGKKQNGGIDLGGDEISQLEKSYDEMITRMFALMEKTRRDMEIQRKLELDALQMQMNTHFLFNTLDAIGWLAKIKKQPEIEGLVINLAKFFRLSLHAGDKFVSVAEEVEIIKHFIEIQKVCYPDKFTIEYNVKKEIASYLSLKLILQPVVENAIKHGLSQRDKAGHITINVYGEGDDIIYEVIDNGSGFDSPDPLVNPKSNSYGLKNINERIKLEYGEEYGIFVKSELGKGSKVTIRIAKRI